MLPASPTAATASALVRPYRRAAAIVPKSGPSTPVAWNPRRWKSRPAAAPRRAATS